MSGRENKYSSSGSSKDKKCTESHCVKGFTHKQYPPDHPEFKPGGCPAFKPPKGQEYYVSDYTGEREKWT